MECKLIAIRLLCHDKKKDTFLLQKCAFQYLLTLCGPYEGFLIPRAEYRR